MGERERGGVCGRRGNGGGKEKEREAIGEREERRKEGGEERERGGRVGRKKRKESGIEKERQTQFISDNYVRRVRISTA